LSGIQLYCASMHRHRTVCSRNSGVKLLLVQAIARWRPVHAAGLRLDCKRFETAGLHSHPTNRKFDVTFGLGVSQPAHRG